MRLVRILKQGVAQGPYLLGKHFTAADVVIGSGIGWALPFKFSFLSFQSSFRMPIDLASAPGCSAKLRWTRSLRKIGPVVSRHSACMSHRLRHRDRGHTHHRTGMKPDDVFRSQLLTTITALRYWAPSIADAARVEEQETADYFKIALTPFIAASCPFELILHNDQKYDLAIAGETYEDRPMPSLDLFLPFVKAIADGNVVHRRWISRLTSLERSTETLVKLDNGYLWRETSGPVDEAPSLDDDGTELRERRFLPYRR